MSKTQKRSPLRIDWISAKQVESSLNDVRPASIRTRRQRRLLVIVNCAMLLSMGFLFRFIPAHDWISVVDLVGLSCLVVLYLMLRTSVRHTSDAPDDFLDERQIRARDAAYIDAYRALSAISITLFLLVLLTNSTLWLGIYLAYLMFAFGLPAMVLAWQLPDEPIEPEIS